MNDSVFSSTVVGGKEVYSKKEGFKGLENIQNLSGCRFLLLNQLFTFRIWQDVASRSNINC